MTAYSIVLFIHLLSLLLATVAASLTTYATLRLRTISESGEATQWLGLIENVVRAFPVATLALFGSGAYLAQTLSVWSAPWVLAALAGLVTIMTLGGGVEARRARALKRELQIAGLSKRARLLLRDPIAWGARGMMLALMVAITFVMTTKPSAAVAAGSLLAAVIAGVLGTMPFWYRQVARMSWRMNLPRRGDVGAHVAAMLPSSGCRPSDH